MLKQTFSEKDILEAFKVFDTEGTGYILASDLKHIVTSIGNKLSKKSAEEMINEADLDKDGKIDYVAFAKLLVFLFIYCRFLFNLIQ